MVEDIRREGGGDEEVDEETGEEVVEEMRRRLVSRLGRMCLVRR